LDYKCDEFAKKEREEAQSVKKTGKWPFSHFPVQSFFIFKV